MNMPKSFQIEISSQECATIVAALDRFFFEVDEAGDESLEKVKKMRTRLMEHQFPDEKLREVMQSRMDMIHMVKYGSSY